jgi:hypothetical protein
MRRNLLPSLGYQRPRCRMGRFDMLIEGVKVQDKVASKCNEGYASGLYKHNGFGKKSIPYSIDDDFDALWIHIPCDWKFFYLFTKQDLLHHGLISNTIQRGKTCIHLHLPGTKTTIVNAWANEFFYRYDDPDIVQNVKAILASTTSK